MSFRKGDIVTILREPPFTDPSAWCKGSFGVVVVSDHLNEDENNNNVPCITISFFDPLHLYSDQHEKYVELYIPITDITK